MKKFIPSFLFTLLSSSALLANSNKELSHFDWMTQELLKINSSDTPYIESDEPFAPLVNAFIAEAHNDAQTAQKYLQQFENTLTPFIQEQIDNAYSNYNKKSFQETLQNIQTAIKEKHTYNTFKELSSKRNIFEYCTSQDQCKPTLISPFSFLQISPHLHPRKKYSTCVDVTTFYPICKGENYSDPEDPQKLPLAIKFAKEPLKYYKDIRYKKPEPQTFAAPAISEPVIPEGEWTFSQALLYMEYNPSKAYNTLKKAQTLTEKLQLALFLKAYYPEKIKEIKNALRDVVKEFGKGDQYLGYSRNYNKETFYKTFASDLAEDNDYLSQDYLSEVVVSASDKGLVDSQYTQIYCGIAKKLPEIIDVTSPYYYSNRDNFIPRLECDYDIDYQKFPKRDIEKFVNLTEKADGHFLSSYQGSMRYGHYARQNLIQNQTFLGILPPDTPQYQIKYPYEVWSYLSLENRKIFLEIKKEYIKTRQTLIDYFTNNRKFSNEKAIKLAEYILFNQPYGTRYWYRTTSSDFQGKIYDTIPQTLRSLMIEQKSLDKIKKFAAAPDFLQKQKILIPRDYIFGHDTQPAPLIHIAVQNPEYLKFLLELTKNMPIEEQQAQDLVTDINARNNIDKTPLMVAAQFDFLESAKILLQNGADVNAVTNDKEGYPGLLHDNRTALMYAAENAGFDMIKLLLDNGADKDITDTRGYKAVDYLMGFAYGDYNEKLSEEEFSKALQLLL